MSRATTWPPRLPRVARARGATHVVIAHRPQTRFERLRRASLADVLMEALPGVELHVVGPGRRG